MNIAKELLRLVNDEEGLTVVEYAIAGGLVAAGVIVAFTALGTNVKEVICYLTDEIGSSPAVSGGGSTC